MATDPPNPEVERLPDSTVVPGADPDPNAGELVAASLVRLMPGGATIEVSQDGQVIEITFPDGSEPQD